MKRLSRILFSIVCLVLAFSVVPFAVSADSLGLSPGVGVGLLKYNSVIDVNSTLFFYSLAWDEANSSVSFGNVYMNADALTKLEVSSDVNLTLTSLSLSMFSYSVVGLGSQNFTGLRQPSSVVIDGVESSEGWSYIDGVLSVFSAYSSVVVYFAASDLSLSIALIVVFSAIAVCIVWVLVGVVWRRRKNEND